MRLYRLLLLLAALVLPACSAVDRTTGIEEGEQILYVAPYTRTCTGMYEMQCMLVRDDPTEAWSNFYDTIEGFTYERGFSYVLRVDVREIPNPPADGSSAAYTLIEVVDKVISIGGE